jgi:uncharacterized protein (TIRG00374 family)
LKLDSRSKVGGIRRWLPGLIISAIAIILLIQFSNWQGVLDALSLMDLRWLAVAIVFYFLGLIFRALSWMTLLQNKASYGRVFITLNEGYLLNNIFPFRLGELGRAVILSQATGVSSLFVISTIIIERAYDVAIAAGLLLATLPFVLELDAGQTIASLVMTLVILILVILFLLARYRHWIINKLDAYGETRLFFRERISRRIESLLDGLGALSRLDQFLLSVVFILLAWFSASVQLYFLALSMGIDAEYWWIGFVIGVISLGIALPSAPAGLGIYEVAMVGAFSLLGVPSSQGLAVALVAHFIHITITGFIALYGIFHDGENIVGLYRRLENIKAS